MASSTYPKGWKATTLGGVVELISGQHVDVDRCNTSGQGVPYLTGPSDFDRGAINCTRFTDAPQVCCEAGDILLTVKGSGTGSLAVADRSYCISRQLMAVRARSVDPFFVRFLLESQTENYSKISAGLIPGISRDDVLSTRFGLPPLEEQRRIVECLSIWTEAVSKTESLIAAKTTLLSKLRERCLRKQPGSRHVKLNSVTREVNERNAGLLDRNSIMGVSNRLGMRPMREETIAKNIDRYKVVRPNAFAYNPMRLNIGSIAKSPFSFNVLVSPDYVVFECEESELLPSYMNHLRLSQRWATHFESAGAGSVRVRVYYEHLGSFGFDLPPLSAQEQVARVLDAALSEIDALHEYANALKIQKVGLSKKLLGGEWRVRMRVAEVA